jgi:hypothetical protein
MAEIIQNEMSDSRSEIVSANAHTRRPWTAPKVTALRAGLAETGLNLGYDGVEGTS